jgi:hypothetical protein
MRPFGAIVLLAAALCASGCQLEETALQKAIKAHDVAAVKTLLEAGAGTGASLAESSSARLLTFSSLEPLEASPSVEVLRIMLAANLQPAAVGTAKDKPFRLADASFRINCRKSPCRDTSAIELAVRSWNPAAVRAMIEAGLTITSQGTTDALVYAIADGNDEAARLLVEAGANLVERASESSGPMGGATPLEAARRKGNAVLEQYLLSKGAR